MSDDETSSSSGASTTSSSGSSYHRRRRRRRGDSSSSTASTSAGASESSTSDEEAEAEEQPPSGISPWSCLVLVVLVLVAAVAFVYWLQRGGAQSSVGGGPTAGSGTSASRSTTVALPGVQATTTVPSDFLSSIASSFSMTPAAFPSLTMPSSALPSGPAASSYLAEAWPAKKGSTEMSFVDDPFDAGAGPVLSVEYEKGHYSGAKNTGGVGNFQMPVFGEGKQRAMVSYEVGFNEGFDFVLGGKLPGLFGGDAGSGCTGGRGSESCFSLRLMWRAAGAGEIYAYIPSYSGQCESGSNSSMMCHGADGISIDRGSYVFTPGSWNTVTEVAILNSEPNANGEANGVLALYAGETRAIYHEDIVFRTNTSVFLNAFIFSTFFGGSSADYAATATCSTYYRNIQFWEGDDASSTKGQTVEASIGGGAAA